ncbi:hypothetical protein KAR52_03805 [Candidatus Pacearchaeota archaeon]|nr:hypothetical protein [Candidatus Pacearchaeota archaeon]
MENKNVGWLIIGIGIVIVIMVLIFNSTLKELATTCCGCGGSCSMSDTVSVQTWISLCIATLIIIIGIFLILTKPKEKIIVKKIKERKKKLDLSGLDKKEKRAIELLQKENNVMFQSELIEKLEIGKVGMTRLLDKLESKQFIERKRRGMNNIVILKD